MTHREKTQGHIERLEQVFENDREAAADQALPGDKWHRRRGEERSRVRRERHDRYRSGCGGAQAVEHYEMARYGALMHGPVTQHAESRGLAERKSTRGDEGGKVPDPSRGEQGYRRH